MLSLEGLAILESGSRDGESQKTGRERMAPGGNYHAGPHQEPHTPGFGGGGGRKKGARGFFLSSDTPLPSKHSAMHSTCCHLEESHPGTGDMLEVESHPGGLTRELVGVTRGKACVTPAGVGRGLETWVT